MKKTQKFLILLLFFYVFCNIFNFFVFDLNFCSASSPKVFDREFNIFVGKKTYTFHSKELVNFEKLSNIQKNMIFDTKNFKQNANLLFEFGLSKAEVCKYLFPEVEIFLNKLSEIYEKTPEKDKVLVIPNSCKISFSIGQDGVFVDRQKFYDDIFDDLISGKQKISAEVFLNNFKDSQNLKNCFKEKSCFSTNFSSSSEERKNNIKVALQKFDGLFLDEGESFSFNTVTGERNLESGYKPAKIISNGTFVEGFGGGVCQVSTTIYNACLLAGLEIVEVHAHSLPVSYIEPSFDAMVNIGSSDLVVRNNSHGKILITTSSENDICKVKIFGLKNQYKVTRISEKIKIIPAEKDIIDCEFQKYGDLKLEVGEEKRLSFAKDGFVSNGYLNFYDEFGNLVKTQKIRQNSYNPTKGIIVKRES